MDDRRHEVRSWRVEKKAGKEHCPEGGLEGIRHRGVEGRPRHRDGGAPDRTLGRQQVSQGFGHARPESTRTARVSTRSKAGNVIWRSVGFIYLFRRQSL